MFTYRGHSALISLRGTLSPGGAIEPLVVDAALLRARILAVNGQRLGQDALIKTHAFHEGACEHHAISLLLATAPKKTKEET